MVDDTLMPVASKASQCVSVLAVIRASHDGSSLRGDTLQLI